MSRVGLSSYHRMKQRAEIAEAEELRLAGQVRYLTERADCFESSVRDAIELQDEVWHLQAALRIVQPTWRHDLGTVVGGVLLAAGLIAAIVWGIYG